MGDHNRRDFAIRIQQFFDHYLMDAPEPEWMATIDLRHTLKSEYGNWPTETLKTDQPGVERLQIRRINPEAVSRGPFDARCEWTFSCDRQELVWNSG